MTLDVFRIKAKRLAQLVRDGFATLVRCIDMHSEELGDLAVVPVLKVVFRENEAFLVRELLEDFRTSLALDPSVVRKTKLILIVFFLDIAVVIAFRFLAILEGRDFVVEIGRILLVLLDVACNLIAKKVVHVAAEGTSDVLIALHKREEDDAEVIINLFLVLMAIALNHEVELRGNGLGCLMPRILPPESFLEVKVRNEETDECTLLGVAEINLATLEQDDVFFEERMETFQELHACGIRVDAVELRGAWLELRLVLEHQIVNLLPLVRMLEEVIDIIAFAFINDAENDDAAGKILCLVRVFEYDVVDFYFCFYCKLFFPMLSPASFVLREINRRKASGCFLLSLLGFLIVLVSFCRHKRVKRCNILQAFDDDLWVNILDKLLLQLEDFCLDAFDVDDSFRPVFIVEDEVCEVFHLADSVTVFHISRNYRVRLLHFEREELPMLRLLFVVPDLLDEDIVTALVQRIELDAVDGCFVCVEF